MNYGYIKEKIRDQMIEPPKSCTAGDLSWWLIGYQDCLKSVMEIIDSIQKEGERA